MIKSLHTHTVAPRWAEKYIHDHPYTNAIKCAGARTHTFLFIMTHTHTHTHTFSCLNPGPKQEAWCVLGSGLCLSSSPCRGTWQWSTGGTGLFKFQYVLLLCTPFVLRFMLATRLPLSFSLWHTRTHIHVTRTLKGHCHRGSWVRGQCPLWSIVVVLHRFASWPSEAIRLRNHYRRVPKHLCNSLV